MATTQTKKETTDAKLKITWHAIDRMYNKIAIKNGSTSTTALVLLNIDPVSGTPVTKIGPSIGLDPRGLSRIFIALEEKGLIKRKSDKDDARKSIVVLTALGKKKRDIAKETVKNFNHQLSLKIGDKKLDTLNKILDEILQIVNNNSK
jgi:DNA-binding MarR family transcriptional regulator